MATIAPRAPSLDPQSSSPWAAALLIGPLVPACFSLCTIAVAQNVQLTDKACEPGSAVDQGGCNFMSGAAACAYLTVLVFSWVFLGTDVDFKFKNRTFKVLRPFTEIRTVAVLYGGIYVVSLAVFFPGLLWVLSPAAREPGSSSQLFFFALFLQLVYWLMSVTMLFTLFSVFLAARKGGAAGTNGASKPSRLSGAANAANSATNRAANANKYKYGSEEWFKEVFKDVAEGSSEQIDSEMLGRLFKALAVELTDAEVAAVTEVLDSDATGDVHFSAVWDWFDKTGRAKRKGGGKNGDSDEDSDEDG